MNVRQLQPEVLLTPISLFNVRANTSRYTSLLHTSIIKSLIVYNLLFKVVVTHLLIYNLIFGQFIINRLVPCYKDLQGWCHCPRGRWSPTLEHTDPLSSLSRRTTQHHCPHTQIPLSVQGSIWRRNPSAPEGKCPSQHHRSCRSPQTHSVVDGMARGTHLPGTSGTQ